MGSVALEQQARLSMRLGLPLSAVTLLRKNEYCAIYGAESDDGPVVVKQYVRGDASLAEREAHGIELYARLTEGDPAFLPIRCVALNRETRTLCMTRTPGELMSRLLRRAHVRRTLRRTATAAMEHVGRFLRTAWQSTRTAETPPSPFLAEYIRYTSGRLERLPLLGRTLFAGYEAEADRLYDELCREGGPTGFSHGDLVFANMIVNGDRIGLIDFANVNEHSHVLNDVYNLRIACDQAPVAIPGLRGRLRAALRQGLGPLDAPEAARRFYWEYHRRRYLSLTLASRRPVGTLQGLLALPKLAAPYRADTLEPRPA